MRRWIQTSLVNRFLFLYIVGTLIPVILLGWTTMRIAYDIVYDMSERLMRDELQIAAVAIEEKYNNVNAISTQIIQDRTLHEELRRDYSENPVECFFWRIKTHGTINSILMVNPDVGGCILLGDSGVGLTVGNVYDISLPRSEVERQLRMTENVNLEFLPLPEGKWKDDSRVLLGKVVRDMSLKRSGHIFFLLEKSAILTSLPEMLQKSNHIFLLVDDENNIIVSDSQMGTRIDQDIVASRDNILDVNGRDYILCSMKLKGVTARVILARPMEEVITRMWPLLTTIVLIGVLIFVLATLLGVQIVRRVGRPLKNLCEATLSVGEGNLQASFPIEGTDEVAELAKCLNEMNAQLAKLTEEKIEQNRQRIHFELLSRHNQINPHFLTNTLNDVKYLAMHHGQADIVETLESLGKILEISLGSDVTIPIKMEVQLLEEYLHILRRHYDGSCAFFVRTQADVMDVQVPALVLQTLVENAIMHGLPEDGMLTVIVEVSGNEQDGVCLSVSDDGIGMNIDEVRDIMRTDPGTSHIGLANVNRRWQLTFGENYPIEIETQPGKGFRVRMHVPPKENG